MEGNGGEGADADLDNFEDNVVLRSSPASKRHSKLHGDWLGRKTSFTILTGEEIRT